MILGVISDTHGYLHPEVEEVFAGVDAILHAGDIGSVGILEALQKMAPTYAVWGNIDGHGLRRLVPEHQRLQLEGVDIWMTHIGGRPGRWAHGIGASLRSDTPDVFVCGHSHILRIERVRSIGRMLYLNPGAAGRQGFHRTKTCVRLHLADGNAHQAEVVHLET